MIELHLAQGVGASVIEKIREGVFAKAPFALREPPLVYVYGCLEKGPGFQTYLNFGRRSNRSACSAEYAPWTRTLRQQRRASIALDSNCCILLKYHVYRSTPVL